MVLRVGVVCCGGCNPDIDRVALVQSLAREMGGPSSWYILEINELHLELPDEISPREENITTHSGLSLVGLLLSIILDFS